MKETIRKEGRKGGRKEGRKEGRKKEGRRRSPGTRGSAYRRAASRW